jgi:hypothetical protein
MIEDLPDAPKVGPMLNLLLTAVLMVRVIQGQGQGGPWDVAHNAIVQLIDERRAVVDRLRLEWAKASVTPIRVAGIAAWLLEVDPRPDAGLYSGATTYLLVVEGRQLRFVEAVDPEKGTSHRIALLRGPSADWRFGPGEGFFAVQSSFGVADSEAEIPRFIIFRRYSFEDGHWVVRERQHPQLDAWVRHREIFPARELFP